MSILLWNYQRIGNKPTEIHLRDLIWKYIPDLIFLIETKQAGEKMEKLRQIYKYNHGDFVNPEGKSGGLAIWRNED